MGRGRNMTRTLSTSRTSSMKVLCDTQETHDCIIHIDTVREEYNWEREFCSLFGGVALSLKVYVLYWGVLRLLVPVTFIIGSTVT